MLEIVRAILCEPVVLLLDEPAAGLNHKEMDYIVALIDKAVEKKICLLYTSPGEHAGHHHGHRDLHKGFRLGAPQTDGGFLHAGTDLTDDCGAGADGRCV